MNRRLRSSTRRGAPIASRANEVGAAAARALGAAALGAMAVGALAVGALAVGRLAIGRARIRRLEIDELVVRDLRVTRDLSFPSTAASEPHRDRSVPPGPAASPLD